MSEFLLDRLKKLTNVLFNKSIDRLINGQME